MNNTRRALLTSLVLVSPAWADTVDFENAADYGGDNAVITQSYFEQYGLNITAVAGSSAADAQEAVLNFEAQGRDGTDAFWTGGGGRDLEKAGSMGDYLLKAGSGDLSYGKSEYFKMTVQYNDATQAASGEVWDIDGPEQYKVTALDANGNALASVTSPVGGLDGKPWAWSFDVGADNITQIDVEFVGASNLRGFAFDNFNATKANPNATTMAAPVPAALPLGAIGMAGLAFLRRRRREFETHDENTSMTS